MSLSSLGWDPFFASALDALQRPALIPARVTLAHKHACVLVSALGELDGICTGRLLHHAAHRADLPAVGDWVAVSPRPGEACADIHAVLPRRTKFSRRAVGHEEEQIVATNIDTVFLVTALDQNYSVRRIERYLAVARESGAQPVVLLNKTDLHPDPVAALAEVTAIAPDVPVITLSARLGDGLDALAPWLVAGRTIALLGSSGVGKSTLINRLLGTGQQLTSVVSDAVGKGRHTTTHRELISTPSGALVIDTPGMRELQLWDVATEAVDSTFADVTALAARCRFHDCQHRSEPGCAIQAALEDGTLDGARWESFQKLRREQAYAARKADPQLARANKAAWKKIHRGVRAHMREKYGD